MILRRWFFLSVVGLSLAYLYKAIARKSWKNPREAQKSKMKLYLAYKPLSSEANKCCWPIISPGNHIKFVLNYLICFFSIQQVREVIRTTQKIFFARLVPLLFYNSNHLKSYLLLKIQGWWILKRKKISYSRPWCMRSY